MVDDRTSRSSFFKVTKKASRSRVSLVNSLSASGPQRSSAAARMAGATTSRVVFMTTSAICSKTLWMTSGFGFCKSTEVKVRPMGAPISVIHPAISVSGCSCQYCRSRTHTHVLTSVMNWSSGGGAGARWLYPVVRPPAILIRPP